MRRIHQRVSLFVVVLAMSASAWAQDEVFTDGFELCRMPDVVEWDGGGDGTSWADPLNWAGDAVPGNGARVSIRPPAPVTVVYGGGLNTSLDCLAMSSSLSISAATLVLDGPATINGSVNLASGLLAANLRMWVGGAFTQASGANVDGAGRLTIGGPFTWTGGMQLGTGETVVLGEAELSSGNIKYLWERTLTLKGPALWLGGNIDTRSAATINVDAPFDIATDADLLHVQFEPGTLNLNDTLTKSAGTGQTDVTLRLQNEGGISVQSGHLAIGNINTSGSSTGQYSVGPGANLTVVGAHSFTSTSSITGAGNFTYVGSLGVFEGALDLTGLFTIGIGSSARFPSGADIGGDVALDISGALNAEGPVNIAGDFSQQAATWVDGAGALTIGGMFTWIGGTQLGAGETVVNGSAEFSSGNDKGLRERTLRLNGPTTWLAGNIDARTGATLELNAPFDIATDADMLHLQLAEPFININGTLTKTAATGATQVAMIATNAGSIAVDSGEIQFLKSYTQAAAGALAVGIAGAADFDTFLVGGAATLDGTLDISLQAGYEPALGESFTILTAASVTGTFATVNGTAIVPGRVFEVGYGPTSVTLTVVAE